MSSSTTSCRLVAATWLLACAPAFAAQITGVVRDAAGRPVAGALVMASSETDVRDAGGGTHRWIMNSDAAGRFAFERLPVGRCHVTAHAGTEGAGIAAAPCVATADDSAIAADVVLQAQPQHAMGHVRRPPGARPSPDDFVMFARVPTDDDPALVVFGARLVDDAWDVQLPAGTWMTKAVIASGESIRMQMTLPGQKKPVELNVASTTAGHPELARELHAMARNDQQVRDTMIATGRMDAATIAPVLRVDRANLARLEQIVRQHGWPTADLVGNDGMEDYWLLAQHAPQAFIAKALPHLKAAADRGEIARSTLALTIDRDLMHRHAPQVYGSQFQGPPCHVEMYRVEDPAHLDERRAEIGLGPIADYKALIEKDCRKTGSAN